MVEISLSGSGEGPGRVTTRPTLQRPFGATAAAPLQRTWCRRGGAGGGRGAPQGCRGGQQAGPGDGHTGGHRRSRMRHPV